MHDNARPYTNTRTKNIFSFEWTMLPHPPYSPKLVTSDYHLFDSMKTCLRGTHFASDEELKTAAMKWLKKQSTEFYEAGILAVIGRRKIAIERNGDYVEE